MDETLKAPARVAPSHETEAPLRVGELAELANLAAYLISDYSAYINGEVVVIDGGEWLAGAGEFSSLAKLKPEDWDKLEAQARARK